MLPLLLALALAGPSSAAPPDLSPLIRSLGSPDGKARAQAVAVLASYGKRAKPALPDLLALFARAPQNERGSLILPLLSISGADESTCGWLIAAMRDDPSSAVRVKAIRYAGARCAKALAILPSLLRDPRASFIDCFTPRGSLGGRPVCERVSAAADALDHASLTADDLAWLGPTLAGGLDDQDPAFRLACLQALRQLPAPRSALPRLLRLLKTGTPLQRRDALAALAAAGPSPTELSAMVDAADQDSLPWLRALARLTVTQARAAPDFFTQELQAPSPARQIRAARWLARLDRAAPQALPLLSRLSGSPDPRLSAAARDAIQAIKAKQALAAAAAADPD